MSEDKSDNLTDLECLKGAFYKVFKCEPNASSITVQKFEPDWEDYIDLDSDAEIEHMDKLKVVVSAATATPVQENKDESCAVSIYVSMALECRARVGTERDIASHQITKIKGFRPTADL